MEAQVAKPQVDVHRIVNPDTNEFCTIVEHIDPKTKRVIGVNPYRMFCVGKETVVFERPLGSGHLWYKNGEPAGQFDWEIHAKAVKERAKNPTEQAIKLGAAHIPWAPEVTGDELLMREAAKQKAENEALKAELAAIKAEKEKVSQPVTKKN